MYEEYLNSKEIVQKIADLKIRLALQQNLNRKWTSWLQKSIRPTQGRPGKSGKWKNRCSGTSLLTRSDERSGMNRNGDSLDVRAL